MVTKKIIYLNKDMIPLGWNTSFLHLITGEKYEQYIIIRWN